MQYRMAQQNGPPRRSNTAAALTKTSRGGLIMAARSIHKFYRDEESLRCRHDAAVDWLAIPVAATLVSAIVIAVVLCMARGVM
jgi:hypothetical protein